MRYFFYHLFFILMLIVCSCSNPQQNNNSASNTQPTKQPVDTADTRLTNDLSEFFTNQINTAKLAETKASTQKVKAFAKQIVQLYTQLGNRLNSTMETYTIKLPSAPATTNQENFEKLSAIKGASFDHAYLLQILKQHNAMIREYNAARNIQNVPLKMFVGSNQADIIKQAYAISALKDVTP